MGSKTSGYFINPSFEGERPTSEESRQQKEITNDAEKETGHANRTEGSKHILLALVTTACLISLLVLLFVILTFGKVSDGLDCAANEVSSSASSKSLMTDSVQIKALGENMTDFQLALNNLMENMNFAFSGLTSNLVKTGNDLAELSNTLRKLETLDSSLTEVTSHLTNTSKVLAEFKNTIGKFSGCQDPCMNGKISYTAGEESKFECVCDPGFYGKYCEKVATSCKEVYAVHNETFHSFTTSRLVTLHFGKTPTSVFCHVGDFGCGDGVWTTVMKIDGSKNTFHYDSSYWSDKSEFYVLGGETGFDDQETKLPTYWNTPFNKICLGMKIDQQIRFTTINTTKTSSLYALIADGNYRNTSLGRDTWKTLIGSEASLQVNCNMEGFNAACSSISNSKARIGFVGNENNDCHSCDSRIGFGTGGNPDDSNTCGNEAKWSPDNGDKSIKAMGYILVQ